MFTENPGTRWKPSHPDFESWENDRSKWAHIAPIDYGQETLFQEYEGGCIGAYKPYAGSTHFQSIRAMCRKALVPNEYEVAMAIFRYGRCYDRTLEKFYYVDTRCRLVLNEKWEWSLYSDPNVYGEYPYK